MRLHVSVQKFDLLFANLAFNFARMRQLVSLQVTLERSLEVTNIATQILRFEVDIFKMILQGDAA